MMKICNSAFTAAITTALELMLSSRLENSNYSAGFIWKKQNLPYSCFSKTIIRQQRTLERREPEQESWFCKVPYRQIVLFYQKPEKGLD